MFDIGFTYRSEYFQSIVDNIGEVDFLEIVPDDLDLNQDTIQSQQIKYLSRLLPLSAHSIELSIASYDDEEFNWRFEKIFPFLEALNIEHYSDHLAYTRSGTVNCDAYVPPLYGIEGPENLIRRVGYLNERLSLIGATFSLENVANTVLADTARPSLEGAFMRQLADSVDLSYILNIDSLLISSCALGISPIELLRTYPVDKIKSVTIVPPEAMNEVMNAQYGILVEQEAMSLFEAALELISPERVVIQVRYSHNTLDTQLHYINRLRSIRSRRHSPSAAEHQELRHAK